MNERSESCHASCLINKSKAATMEVQNGAKPGQMVHRSVWAMGQRLAEVRCVALHTGRARA